MGIYSTPIRVVCARMKMIEYVEWACSRYHAVGTPMIKGNACGWIGGYHAFLMVYVQICVQK